MAIDATQVPTHAGRRRLLAAALGLAAGARAAPSWAATPAVPSVGATVLAAAWTSTSTPPTDHVGLLAIEPARGRIPARSRVLASLELPGRAHGLIALPDGSLLAVARRPGDWLLRWDARGGAPRWFWIEPDRAFTGHALLAADGRTLFTVETDLASGTGMIGVRDAVSLDKRAEWPTQGRDPHMLTLDHGGALVVANGGIATRPETGRRKLGLEAMDASLVRLAPADGALRGLWRLDDERLSIRHLAWSRDAAGRAVLGIALQAEHDDPARRAAVPVLALFDGERLRCADAPHGPSHTDDHDDHNDALGGYGGDIAGLASGFAVSCPRALTRTGSEAGSVARWDASGRPLGRIAWPQACALAADGGALWCGGVAAASIDAADSVQGHALPSLRLDNHWLRLG